MQVECYITSAVQYVYYRHGNIDYFGAKIYLFIYNTMSRYKAIHRYLYLQNPNNLVHCGEKKFKAKGGEKLGFIYLFPNI